MNFRSLASLFFLSYLFAVSGTNAQSNPTPPPVQLQAATPAQASSVTKPTYDLMRYAIADGSTTKHFWVASVWGAPMQPSKAGGDPPVPRDAFQSLAAPQLRDWVSQLPPGSCIVVLGWLGPQRNTRGPHIPDQFHLEINDFKHFCESKNVQFCFGMCGG